MKNKKKNPKTESHPLSFSGDATTAAELDIKALVREHSLFFDKLVELIPARFYLPTDDAKEKPWFQGLSKVAKASAKKETRENVKKSRRDRLDPEKASGTGEMLRRAVEERDPADDDEVSAKRDGARTLEELRERIRKKRAELAAARAPKAENVVKRAKRRELFKGKRKREDGGEEKEPIGDSSSDAVRRKAENAAADGLAFTHVKLGGDGGGKKNKKRKLSKAQVLERAEKLVEAKKDPEKGGAVAEKQSWKAAADRAMGVKVHDDPKLVRQSMKKEKKRQQKSAEKWTERVEGVQKSRAGAQQVRAQHIADRIHDKKMRKIAKREKKLMRPGFEGRKEGFINDS